MSALRLVRPFALLSITIEYAVQAPRNQARAVRSGNERAVIGLALTPRSRWCLLASRPSTRQHARSRRQANAANHYDRIQNLVRGCRARDRDDADRAGRQARRP